MEGKNNILIVCFSFPPFPGIGGRRWAKFAKHLAKQNFNVQVLAAENNSSIVSEWAKDVAHKNITLTTIPLGLSKVFSFYPKSIFEKLTYKFLSLKARFQIQGNKQDKIFFIKDRLLNTADRIISKNKISTIIITIPPYKLSYYLLSLKKKYPNIKFIVDYRDPWTDNRSYHGFADISSEDLKAEIEYEKEVLKMADVVFDVNKQSLKVLSVKVSTRAKFMHLPNGYDNDDYTGFEAVNSTGNGLHFVYTGSFYPNLVDSLRSLVACLKRIETENNSLYKQLHFDFYGNMDHNAVELLKQSNCNAIQFHGNLPQKEVLKKIATANYCMLFSAVDHNHAMNTKFYEYLYFKKPILYFGGKGDTSDFILNNKVGLMFEPEGMQESLHSFLCSNELKCFKADPSLDISAFEIGTITKTLIKAIHD